ncbi:MAG: hypothetical protein J2P55_01625 [Rhizobiales bacterium]|nr:hypothetical protein [Hyphomicrobiales bacterium]
MKTFAILAALLLAASPAAAEVVTPNGQAQLARPNGQAQAPITGVFCIEEMTANFCNVVAGPNTGGYGARTGSATSGGSGAGAASAGVSAGAGGGGPSSIPPCPSEPPFNEFCN